VSVNPTSTDYVQGTSERGQNSDVMTKQSTSNKLLKVDFRWELDFWCGEEEPSRREVDRL